MSFIGPTGRQLEGKDGAILQANTYRWSVVD